jgi:predicted DNA-binding transcriptional regulator AlpA
MKTSTVEIVAAALRGDGGISQQRIDATLRLLKEGSLPASLERGPLPLLLMQAQAARLLGCSRFTLRRAVKDGRLQPIHLTPGCVRYRTSDIQSLAANGVSR